jgi:RimJ/RimL family protein N-acetyltransferase
MSRTVFETERLVIRTSDVGDAPMYVALWNDPRVMTNVGFPEGLGVTVEEIEENIRKKPDSDYEQYLVVVRKSDGASLGECKLHRPDEEGIASTDVKLLPEFWGHKYGVEVKQGLVDYQFTHSDCVAVQGSPNVNNPASIHMQEAVGGVRVRDATYEFGEDMEMETTDLRLHIYRVFREEWVRRREAASAPDRPSGH